MMNVVILSDLETQGGAAIAASRLSQGLCDAGVRVTRIVAYPDFKQHSWKTIPFGIQPNFMDRQFRKIFTADLVENYDRKKAALQLRKLLRSIQPDIINVHNLHSALSLGWSLDFPLVCQDFASTVWTLHDMWSFTGRCAYSFECRKFLAGCDASCPTPDEYPSLAPHKIEGEWNKRARLVQKSSGNACVTPSHWLAKEAAAGLWHDASVEIIPNGLPVDIFKPLNRSDARKALGLEPSGRVLITAAHNLQERRKGGYFLEQALNLGFDEDLTLITMGNNELHIDSKQIKVFPLGYVEDNYRKVLAYNAADLLVHPAPVDNLPNVVLESIACGTPALAFSVCGVPEVVRHGITGWLSTEVSGMALTETLRAALQDLHRGIDLRESCRKVAESEYALPLQVRRYINMFSKMKSEKSQGITKTEKVNW